MSELNPINPPQIECNTSLYQRLIPFLWLIEIYEKRGSSSGSGSGSGSKKKVVETLSGFGLYKSNLIITWRAGMFDNNRMRMSMSIRARRLMGEDYEFKDCTIKKEMPKVDLVVIVVDQMAGDDNVLKLGSGNLEVGQRVFSLGNPIGFEGSFLTGEIAFGCREVEYKTGKETCDHYQNTLENQQGSDYRIMGNYFNTGWFKKSINKENANYEKSKGLHPRIQIVQLNGMTVKEGCFGGPLCNYKGEVVGIMYGGIGWYPVAIHVSVLKKVEAGLRKMAEKEELEQAEKKRDIGTSEDSRFMSKRTKLE